MQALPSVYKTIAEGGSLFYTWFEALHTRIDIAVCHLAEKDCKELAARVRQELLRIEKIMNRFDPKSELSILNSQAANGHADASQELAQAILDCMRYRELTCGYFDIAIHSDTKIAPPLVSVQPSSPGKTGDHSHQITFKHPKVSLDLGGYAKGYALDRSKEIVAAFGCRNALLSFGNSSVLAMGNHPVGQGWKISAAGQAQEETLFDECLTTSGNEHGKQHILSPVSGKLIQQDFTLSVKSPTGSDGEALSTALFAAYGDYLANGGDPNIPREDIPIISQILEGFGEGCRLVGVSRVDGLD